MKEKLNISILGIGTELTSGQILNRNAQWISQKMHKLGAHCPLHEVVPDERELILKALKNCAAHSDIIFITGGLGPTTDDFTRDVIAEWTSSKMRWDEASWQHLNERLNSRGIPVKEMQKQQCYFPEKAQVLLNRMGTANGFHLKHLDKDLYVLPGPPKEIESIWNDWIQNAMEIRCEKIEKTFTRTWDTLGLGESQVAELTEAALEACPFEKAYRVHLPYVEFKLTYTSSQASQAERWIQAVEKAIGSVTLLRDGEDIAELLVKKLQIYPQVSIFDESLSGFLIKRLFPFSKNLFAHSQVSFHNYKAAEIKASHLALSLSVNKEGLAEAKIHFAGTEDSVKIPSPFSSTLMLERAHQYFAEKAMVFFLEHIEKAQKIS